ncbi:MAG: 2-oxoacid:acceptor oxidoreductase family protein [Nocardioides sp.]
MSASAADGRQVTEIRFHGRGGQGVVTAAELLSAAAFDQGLSAQAIPSFGSERTGAPVVAYCRVAAHPIRSHDPVVSPDVVVVQDPTMLHIAGVLDGLAPQGLLVVNSGRSPRELGLERLPGRVVTVPASELARERLGRPLPNTALLGALVALTSVVSLHDLQSAIQERFHGAAGAQNAALAADGHRMALASLESGRARAQAG